MSSDFAVERRCLHRNKTGIVQLSGTHIIWTPDSAEDGIELRIAVANITNFQVSKQNNAKKAAMKLDCKEYGSVVLNFQTNFSDREAIREVIVAMMARGRQALANQNGSANGNGGSAAKSKSKPQLKLSPQEHEWQIKLMGKREVLRLRRRLVDTGAISDEKFWKGMKYRYMQNCKLRPNGKEVEEDTPLEAKDLGVPAEAFTARRGSKVDVEKWGKIPTPAQQHIAILEHPTVARSKKALVKQIGEERFWELFRWSSMAKHGSLSRAQTAQMAEADNIFAPYHAREREMEEEERENRARGLSKGLDLGHSDDHRSAHVLDAHVAGGEARPRKRLRVPDTGALRLLKTVNRHGALIVEEGSASNWDEQAARGRPLDDLEIEAEPVFAKFEMEAKRNVAAPTHEGEDVAMRSMAHAAWTQLQGWEPDFTRFRKPIPGSGKTLEEVIKRMQR